MPFLVSDTVRRAVWDKRLEVYVAHEFYGEILGIQARKSKTVGKLKTFINYVSYAVMGILMLAFPFLTDDFPALYLVEGAGLWGVLTAGVSQVSTKLAGHELTLVDVFKDVARLRNAVDDLWLLVDDESSTDQQIRLTLDTLGVRFTEAQNRVPALKHQHSGIYDECHNRITDETATI